MTNTLIKKAFGVGLNVYYPKVALVGEGFAGVPGVADLPVAYEYALEPAAKITGDTLFASQTSSGTVVLKASETFLEVSITPEPGSSINYPSAGGAIATDIVVTFSEDVLVDDLSLVTLVENPAETAVDLAGVTNVTGSVFTISAALIASGQNELVLTIPVGAFSGNPSENVLDGIYTATYVANPV